MKPGARALGVAESTRGRPDADRSTLAGAVVRADSVVDGLGFAACTVGGTDATDAVVSLVDDVARPDVGHVVLGAVAPAWYNLLDLSRIHDAAERPVIAVTFEASDGLEPALEDAFSGTDLEARLETYRSLPERRSLSVGDETVYVRQVGLEPAAADEVVRTLTASGGRPEPVRVARLAARGADAYVDSLAEE